MKIIGYIRMGDKTACGGEVVEGIDHTNSYGRPYAFCGARISCRRGCEIAEGLPNASAYDKALVIHGMVTTGGCPCISTLNDIDGKGNETGADIPETYILNNGEWVGVKHHAEHDETFDEYFVLTDEQDGPTARNRFYRIELETGEIIEGHTDEHGRTSLATSDKRVPVKIEIAPPSTIQPD